MGVKIATLLNAHGNTPLVLDTLSAIKMYVGDDILTLVDGCSWDWAEKISLPCHKVKGFNHGYPKGPYRNLTLGLKLIYDLFEADWYCYCEPDVLFISSKFKEDLKDAWCIGADYRNGQYKFPYLEKMFNIELKDSHYLLGCCVFYHRDFLTKLKEIEFFDIFLASTQQFSKGYFPDYEEQGGYDFGEHLFPTLATHFGGNIKELSKWHPIFCHWQGNFKQYPLRWQPELDWEDNFAEASIMHPVKTMGDLRWFHKTKREKLCMISKP